MQKAVAITASKGQPWHRHQCSQGEEEERVKEKARRRRKKDEEEKEDSSTAFKFRANSMEGGRKGGHRTLDRAWRPEPFDEEPLGNTAGEKKGWMLES